MNRKIVETDIEQLSKTAKAMESKQSRKLKTAIRQYNQVVQQNKDLQTERNVYRKALEEFKPQPKRAKIIQAPQLKYKENVVVYTFENEQEIINIETVGYFSGGYNGEKLKANVITIKIVDGRKTDLKINKDVFDIEFKLIEGQKCQI